MGIGITADSFIVYFERVKDELREGKPLNAAVESGWFRARRTILVSGAVSLLASVTLYILTVGNVKGFAFTLGLTTVIDITVVFLFTYPAFRLLAKSKFFLSGGKFTGLELKSTPTFGYTGRGTFRVSEAVSTGKAAKSSKEAVRRQTIAERKAAGEAILNTKKEEGN
jgi:preprotein translocase subunit SecD